jgi:hypothetical protein
MLDHQNGPVISVSISSVSGIIAALTVQQIRLYSINGDLISYINLCNQQQHQQHNHHHHHFQQQQQQQQQPHYRNTANVMNEPTVILVTPCLLGQDGVKLVTGHKGGYIYLWKLRKFTNNNNDENVDNRGQSSSSSSYKNHDNTDNNRSSGNKIHSYKTIKNESQLLELFITSIPTRTHKASITVLKLCSTNYTIKSKEIISRSLEDRRYLDLLVGDNDGYVSRWSTLKLDQLTSFDLLSIISDI